MPGILWGVSTAIALTERGMSYSHWKILPPGLLKKTYDQWSKLRPDVRALTVELAKYQRFKCALCIQDRDLIIDHDHWPQEGPGVGYTIHNIRGLVCSRCNWHLMVYEKTNDGDYLNWENANSHLSDIEYDNYIYFYKCRVYPLNEAAQEQRVGCKNFWRRRLVLQKFDEWFYEGGYAPSWYLKYKEKEQWEIKTPEQFIEHLTAYVDFVKEELKKNPSYQPPDELLKALARTLQIANQAITIGRKDVVDDFVVTPHETSPL